MEKILKVKHVNDYARYIGAPVLHPLVSVIHYDELEHCRHSLNNYDVYAMFIGDETLEQLTYGLTTYDLHRHALMCVAPGQIGGKADTGQEIHTKGWALLFDPELLHGTDVERRLPSYTYFTYNTSEALLMSDPQRQTIVNLLEHIRQEATTADDAHSRPILVHLIGLVLEHVARFYALQLSAPSSEKDDLLLRFESLLANYYRDGLQQKLGLPTVRYCAQELFLSPNYFGDLIRQLTGDTASNIIRRFVMQRAKELLAGSTPIGQVAEQLGFDYPQHFTRQFKSHFGITPTQFVKGRK
ncbi:MAG: helix-turn-helix transcriptional regulator [Bacteroidaceae bacterium]|nr:helix-turn-helix transcriptional regulator [Bacteroidaceae bacterium]